jgi:transcriptional regulator with XRE-family HTH domain
MQIKDQIRARREQLGVSVNELAKRLGVSSQAIRHWESGRSFPGKSKAPGVEAALSFTLDWTQGKRADATKSQMAALLGQGDIDLLMLLCRLPAPFKALLTNLAQMHLAAITGDKRAFSGAKTEEPKSPFKDKVEEMKVAKIATKAAVKRPAVRKKAAR